MAKIPEKTLVQRIDSIDVPSDTRTYLGGSYVGHECLRYVWYKFRWFPEDRIEARMNRLFRLGDRIEDQIIEALATVGIVVDGNQESVGGYMGHADGHTDGTANYEGIDTLFEAKSMSDANFKKYKKVGLREFNRKYWFQIQGYMGKLELPACLYAVYNKNNSELDIQMIPFCETTFRLVNLTEIEIISTENPDKFNRLGNSTWYACKFCEAADVCHHGAKPVKSCRSCFYVDVQADGKWYCLNYKRNLSKQDQLAACDDYVVIEEAKK